MSRLRALASATWLHVAVGAAAMGAWAAFANHGLGAAVMLKAGLVQAALSGAITAGLKRTLEGMGEAIAPPLDALLPPTVTCLAVLAILVGAHTLAGTPNLWRAIAAPYAVSSAYAWVYSLARRRPHIAGAERPA